MATTDYQTTTPLGTISGENGSKIMISGESLTGQLFQTIQVTKDGTLTTCSGTKRGVPYDYLSDDDRNFGTVTAGDFLITGKDCFITDIAVGGGGRIIAT